MYIPALYKNENLAEVKSFLQQNSFGILISNTDKKLHGTHIPLELDIDENGDDVLLGHISKENPQWQYFDENEEVLCIFNGPHAYISSSWYDHENVPTWNYIAVHVYGKISILNDVEVMDSLRKLVDKYEQNSKNPVSVHTMSAKTLRQAKGVVGFRIKITSIQAAYKLSQNRDDHNYHRIIDELEQKKEIASTAISEAMRKNRNS